MIAGAVALRPSRGLKPPAPPPLARDIIHSSRLGRGDLTSRGRTMKTFINMLRDDRGASAAEYALILAIIGAIIAIAAVGLSQAIGGAMNTAAACINAG